MRVAGIGLGLAAGLLWAGVAWGQALPTAARIESVPIELVLPDRYQVSEVLEPVRRITLVAPADGVIRGLDARLGATVQESQELVQLDRSEASARLAIAVAEVKEKQALLKGGKADQEVAAAQLEAAQARANLAKLMLDRCTLHAPFTGRVTAVPVSIGQYVLKGTTIAELADLSSLKALQPVDRRHVKTGSELSVQVEEQEVSGKVVAIVPLPEKYAPLRELVTPFAAASVAFSNRKGGLEPGMRVRAGVVPSTPIAVVPKRAVKHEDSRGTEAAVVQVIRNEYVSNIPVQVLGDVGPDRSQITGALRETDALVVASSVPLVPGTLVRFGEGTAPGGVEGTAPSPHVGGVRAGVLTPGTPPGGQRRGVPAASGPARRSPNQPRPAQAPGEASTPF